MKSRQLTYDEKKAAEAAFKGQPADPKWSIGARIVYEGIREAMRTKAAPVGVSVAAADEAVLEEGLTPSEGAEPMTAHR